METIKSLVRNLAVILLIATFLEFLLPNKSMRKFVQLVMGIFVISAILGPITQFFNYTLEMNVPAWVSTQENDIPALARDDRGIVIGNNAVQEQYRTILKNQIQAIALTVKNVQKADVSIEFHENRQSQQPIINKVRVAITTTLDEFKIDRIEPIVIGKENTVHKDKNEQSIEITEKAKEVKEKIVELMGLSPDIVEVEEI